jgi:hypothetical protein
MYGEGHDYAPQYTAMCGDMVGSLPVGTQTCRERDVPYWPAANCYNFKEVWVQPSLLWLWVMADLMEPLDLRPDRPVVTGATTAQGEVRVCARLAGAGGGHGSARTISCSGSLLESRPQPPAGSVSPSGQPLLSDPAGRGWRLLSPTAISGSGVKR